MTAETTRDACATACDPPGPPSTRSPLISSSWEPLPAPLTAGAGLTARAVAAAPAIGAVVVSAAMDAAAAAVAAARRIPGRYKAVSFRSGTDRGGGLGPQKAPVPSGVPRPVGES